MDTLSKTQVFLKSNLDNVLENPYVMAVLKISLILYASMIAPKLPMGLQSLLSNTFVKIFVIILIAYLAQVDFQLAIIIAVIYVLGLNVLAGRGLFESYGNVYRNSFGEDRGPFYADQTKYQNLLEQPAVIGSATLLDSNSDNYSSCDSITMKDLLSAFDDDHIKLQDTLAYAVKSLLEQLPSGTDARARLVNIAKAIGVPGNVNFDDPMSAKYIATILVNYGYKVTDLCSPPKGDDMIN
jgi:hypothetical protein